MVDVQHRFGFTQIESGLRNSNVPQVRVLVLDLCGIATVLNPPPSLYRGQPQRQCGEKRGGFPPALLKQNALTGQLLLGWTGEPRDEDTGITALFQTA